MKRSQMRMLKMAIATARLGYDTWLLVTVLCVDCVVSNFYVARPFPFLRVAKCGHCKSNSSRF